MSPRFCGMRGGAVPKFVVACDSFKGSLNAAEACKAVALGVFDACPEAQVVEFPVADGGEGTAEILSRHLGALRVTVTVHNPLLRKAEATYGIATIQGVKTAIIDMASASGLGMLTPAERNPLIATTLGVGELIADALGRGCRHIVMGVGGSATVDAGKGMLEALGAKFLDAEGKCLSHGGSSLNSLAAIDVSRLDERLQPTRFTVLCDVDNPLCGPTGAARVFAPQKGATEGDVELLERGMERYAAIIGGDFANRARCGAGGGISAALAAFAGAELCSGIDKVLEMTGFSHAISGSNVILTGEGCSDAQTLRGKAPMGVLRHVGTVPVGLISGLVCDREVLESAGFSWVVAATPAGMPLSQAMNPAIAAANLRAAAAASCKAR